MSDYFKSSAYLRSAIEKVAAKIEDVKDQISTKRSESSSELVRLQEELIEHQDVLIGIFQYQDILLKELKHPPN